MKKKQKHIRVNLQRWDIKLSKFKEYLIENILKTEHKKEKDEEGYRIADEINATYIGYTSDTDLMWFNDNVTDSSFFAKSLDEAYEKVRRMRIRFGVGELEVA